MAWTGPPSRPVGAAAVVTTISGQPSWYASIPAAMSNSTTSRPSAKRNVRSGRMSAPPQWVPISASRRSPSYSSGGAPLPATSTIQWPLCMKWRVRLIVEACRAASNTRYVFGKAAWSMPLSKSSIHELALECAVLTPATSGKHHAGGPAGIAPSGGPPGSQGPIAKRADPASVIPPISCVGAAAWRCRGAPTAGAGAAAHDATTSAAKSSARARICDRVYESDAPHRWYDYRSEIVRPRPCGRVRLRRLPGLHTSADRHPDPGRAAGVAERRADAVTDAEGAARRHPPRGARRADRIRRSAIRGREPARDRPGLRRARRARRQRSNAGALYEVAPRVPLRLL